MVHSSPFLTSAISFLKLLILLANIYPVIGVPFLKTCILLVFANLPLRTRTPGTSTTSYVPFLPLILKISATTHRPFSVPLIMAPFLRLIADSSKSLRKLWINLWTFVTILRSFCINKASELTSAPKVNISALHVCAYSKSFVVTSPISDFKMLTVISFFSFKRSIMGWICSWMVYSMPRSAKRRMTLKLLLLMPILTKNWYTYCLWLANSSYFASRSSSYLGFLAACYLSSSIFWLISFYFS